MRKASFVQLTLRTALLSGLMTILAIAGPPLLCHPFDIDGANSLPWGTGGWDKPDRTYDRSHLVADTLALLTPQTPVIVRMETLRRAALYSTEDPRNGYELLARLLARAVSDDRLATFDAGYLVETFKQAKEIGKHAVATDLDGSRWVAAAMERSTDRPSMEFAASTHGQVQMAQYSRSESPVRSRAERAACPESETLRALTVSGDPDRDREPVRTPSNPNSAARRNLSGRQTMSNIDTVKELYAAFGRGDIPTILAHLADDVSWEVEVPAIISFGGIRHGIPDATGFFTAIAADHGDPQLQMPDIFGSGDHVAAFGRYQATMKSTGKRVDTPLAHFWTFRDGKVVRYVNYLNSAGFVEALQPSAATAAR